MTDLIVLEMEEYLAFLAFREGYSLSVFDNNMDLFFSKYFSSFLLSA